MQQQQRKHKIFVIFPSASGHINPVCGLVHELCRQSNVECIFYGIEEHREQIEKTGAQFRLYAHRNLADMDIKNFEEQKEKTSLIAIALNLMMDCSHVLLPQLIDDVKREKPDLILYDTCFVPVKYLMEILKKKKDLDIKYIEFYPNFAFTKEMRSKMFQFKKTIWAVLTLMYTLIYIFFRQLVLSWKFKIPVFNPFGLFTKRGNCDKIVAVVPELQPGREEFDQTFKFVGPCVSEDARNHENTDDKEMNSLLDLFPVKSDTNTNSKNELKLIFMSLGTLYNNRVDIYETIIKAVKEFEANPNRHFKSSQLRVIISTGKEAFKFYSEKISKGELNLPNILLRPRVPQLEILKRADLFITHCGMNSTSETIKYGVPVIAIPLEGDQPINAARICDELSLGIRFDQAKLSADEIADAIDKVLGEEKYRNNMKEFSKISAKYNGHIEGTQIILHCLKGKNVTVKKCD